MSNVVSSALNRWRIAAIAVIACVCVVVAGPARADDVPHLFVYSGTAGFRHISITHAKDVLARVAAETGAFTVEFSEDSASLNAETLARADAVMWLSSTGSQSPFADQQEQAYVEWMRCGGGHVGIHASSDSWKTSWPEWVEVTGAFFQGHPLTATSAADDQFKDPNGALVEGWGEPEATLRIADAEHAATAPWRGQASFNLRDEYYYYDRDPATVMADFNALLTFDQFTNPAEELAFGRNYAENMPVAWTGSFRGWNRTFYTNLGHSVATWNNTDFIEHVVAGVLWAASAPTPADCGQA